MRRRNGRNQPQKNAENAKRRTVILPPHEPLGTSNIQHPTPNLQSMALETIGCSMLDVGCWMFPSVQRIFRGNLSLADAGINQFGRSHSSNFSFRVSHSRPVGTVSGA